MWKNMVGEAGVALALAARYEYFSLQYGYDSLPPCVLQTAQSVVNITLRKKRGYKKECSISYLRQLNYNGIKLKLKQDLIPY